MSNFIEVSRIIPDRSRAWGPSDTDDVGENGPKTQSAVISIAAIRCFYPRKNNEPGCRITFTDGGGFAVLNAYDAMVTALNQAREADHIVAVSRLEPIAPAMVEGPRPLGEILPNDL